MEKSQEFNNRRATFILDSRVVPQLLALMNLISSWQCTMYGFGGFQLLDLIITELKSHMLKIQGLLCTGGNFICQKKILYKICFPV